MRTIREIIGLPVLMDGVCIGRALCCEMDESLKFIRMLWVSAGCLGARGIDRTHVRHIGEIAIRVDSSGKRGRPRSTTLFRRAISTDGTRLGAIVDASFDDSMKVSRLWLSRGYPDDIHSGRCPVERYSVRDSDGAVLISIGEEERR